MSKLSSLFFNAFLFVFTALAAEEHIAKVNGIEIWYETFGQKENPAVLLIMGSGGQGVLWPKNLCEIMAKENLYVIRYDNRDTGHSSYIDYRKQPYNLMDMALDATALLTHLKIRSTHIIGASMGGAIAQLIAVHFPRRVLSLTLISSSYEFGNAITAFQGIPPVNPLLSSPDMAYIEWIYSLMKKPAKTFEEKLDQQLQGWEIINGRECPFDKDVMKELVELSLKRDANTESMVNHFNAIKASLEQVRHAPYLIKAPTLVIHGTKDPVFGLDHGLALAEAIENSKFLVLEGMGHAINSSFFNIGITKVIDHILDRNE